MAVAMQADDFPYLPSGPAEVNKMIKEHGDLFSDSQCKICSAVLISESQKLTHYQSKKHANKVRRYFSVQNDKEPLLKKLKSSTSDSAESHFQGKVQTKNLSVKSVGPQTPAAASQTPPPAQPKKKPADASSSMPSTGSNNNNNNNNPDRFCSICQASFNNPLMAQQHYVGKKHRKQMTKLKLMETYGPSSAPASTLKGYPCTICNIELNSVEQYQSHISGAKHKNQVKKSGLNTTENHDAAQESHGGDKKFSPPVDQCRQADDKYSNKDDQYTTADDQYTAGDNQYAPEDTEYSEEYQFT